MIVHIKWALLTVILSISGQYTVHMFELEFAIGGLFTWNSSKAELASNEGTLIWLTNVLSLKSVSSQTF